MQGRWLTLERFELTVGTYDLRTHVEQGGEVTFVFDENSGLPAGVGMRLLSLLNQLAVHAARGGGEVRLQFATPDRLYGYLNRNGFFDFLDTRIGCTPERPRFSNADRYRGQAESLVEIAALRPGVVGEARADTLTPLTDALRRFYGSGPKARHLINSAFTTLSELMDNVYSHSESELPGFAILQAYPNRARPTVEIAVSDSGIGIPASIRQALGNRVSKQSDARLIIQAFGKGLSRYGTNSGRSCGLPRCAQLASEFGSTVHVRTPEADLTLGAPSSSKLPRPIIRLPAAHLAGTHICLEFPLG